MGDSASFYTLSFHSYFSGTAGDSLSVHKGCKFATYDNDSANACGASYSSGWWFNDNAECFVFFLILYLI